MGVLVALQGLKDYWQYIVIASLLVFIVVQKSWINGLKYEVIAAQVTINEYKAASEAQEKRYLIAEKEVQIMKKAQDREMQDIQEQLKIDNGTPCDAAVMQGIIAGRKLK